MSIDISPVAKIDIPAGYKSGFVRKIFKALGHECLFVGGCVRDAIIARPCKDIDLATPLVPDAVIAALQKAKIMVIPTGIDHGTVTAVDTHHKIHVEITTLRRDVETDGRRAVVTYTTDWREDAARRDFTFNSLLMDLKGHVYDPLGEGYDDLKHRRLRFIGSAEMRIREDYLRILRYFRFAARMNLEFDDHILTVMKPLAQGLSGISIERITDEIFKILQCEAPQRAVAVLRSYDEFGWIGSGYMKLDHFCKLQKDLKCISLVGRVFLVSSASQNEESRYLNLPKAMQAEISQIINVLNEYPHRSIEYMLYYFDHDCIKQAAIYMHALGKISEFSLDFIMSEIRAWKHVVLPLRGIDLLAEGYEQGPLLGAALKYIETWWLERKFKPNREACLHEALKWLSKNQA